MLPRRMAVPQSAKHFAEKLHTCLDDIDAPAQIREPASVLSKMLDISKHEALMLLEGHQYPNDLLIERIALEFDVEKTWLTSS